MNRDTLVALLPHYVAMLLIVFIALEAWRQYIGQLSLVGEFVLIAAIVFAYRPVVKRLGIAPEPWRD